MPDCDLPCQADDALPNLSIADAFGSLAGIVYVWQTNSNRAFNFRRVEYRAISDDCDMEGSDSVDTVAGIVYGLVRNGYEFVLGHDPDGAVMPVNNIVRSLFYPSIRLGEHSCVKPAA